MLCPSLLVFDRKGEFKIGGYRYVIVLRVHCSEFWHIVQEKCLPRSRRWRSRRWIWTIALVSILIFNLTLPTFNAWNRSGNVVKYQQEPITKSKYHDQIENDDEDVSHDHDDEPEVRYWSDFNRLYYTPNTIQRLPDTTDWESAEGDWQGGREMFKRYDEVRWFFLKGWLTKWISVIRKQN